MSRWRVFLRGMSRTFSFGLARGRREHPMSPEEHFAEAFDDLDVAVATAFEAKRWKTLLARLD